MSRAQPATRRRTADARVPGRAPFSDRGRFVALVAILAIVLVVVGLVSVSVGAVAIDIGDVWRVVGARLIGSVADVDPVVDQIVWTVRLPRTVLGIVVGAGLAVAGAVIQAVVRNALGDPYLIGIVPGASLGAVGVIVLGSGAVYGLSLSGAAFVGAMLAFAFTFALGRQHGEWPPSRLVLAGVAVGYLLSAVTFFLQTLATPNQLQRVLFWSLGSIAGAEWRDLPLLTAVIATGVVWLVASGPRLNALVSGSDLTRSLGINVARFQLRLMVFAALVTGCIVAVAGGIGFIGLMVPHIARLLVGAEHRRVLLTCPFLGGIVLLISDLAARLVLAPAELPLGIVTAAIGAPFFIWLLASRTGTRAGT